MKIYDIGDMSFCVSVPQGFNESAYLRVSHLSFERILNTIPDGVADKTQVLDQFNFQEHVRAKLSAD